MSDSFIALDPDTQLGYLLVVCADRISRAWHGALRAEGINPRQFSMLAVLARDPGISQAELARKVMITPQSLGESLTRLLDAGLIERAPTEPGKPARLVLTDDGRHRLTDAYPIVESFNRTGFATLTEPEREDLARLLRKLIAGEEAKPASGPA